MVHADAITSLLAERGYPGMIPVFQDCIDLKDDEQVVIKMTGDAVTQSSGSAISTETAIANTTPGVNNNAYFCTYR
jgi:hypothetical protein